MGEKRILINLKLLYYNKKVIFLHHNSNKDVVFDIAFGNFCFTELLHTKLFI